RHRTNNQVPSQRLIDELLDGEVSRERSQELRRALRQDAKASEELARTQRALDRLREPIETPDLSEAILARVHGRRRFIPHRARHLVTAGRLAVAAGVIGAIGLASFVQRHAPAVNLGDSAMPVTELVEAAEQTGAEQAILGAQTVETIQASITSPTRSLPLSPRFRPEAGLHFDLSLDRSRALVAKEYTPQYTMVQTPILGAPEQFGPPAAEVSSPFINRFGPLLVILREPRPMLDDPSTVEADESNQSTRNRGTDK
ncbi:hypothetical protein MNBD_PLANCTO03-1670, partial [hydrothermal vent metagenome]